MGFSYNVNVLNQKGSPALYTDTFANRPNFGYAGRLFIANDTSAIYEDTGTAWVLIANVSSGAGTLQQVTTNGNTSNVGISITAGGLSTNSLTDTALTLGSVLFAGAAGLVTQDNAAFYWDDTNNRLGINTVTPSNTLDIHFAGTGASIGINNTAGNPATIVYANTGTNKWRVGNSATNTFDFFNVALASIAAYLDNTNNAATFNGSLQVLSSGGQRDTTSNLNSSIVDSRAAVNVTPAARFSNVGSGYVTKLILSDTINADCAITFQPNATIANSTFGIGINSFNNIVLKGDGKVGIGNASPSRNLVVQNSATVSAISIVANPANISYLLLGNTTSDDLGRVQYDNSINSLQLGTNGVIKASLTTNGAFLINTLTDDTVNKLQIAGGTKITNSSTAFALNATSAYTIAAANNPIITFGRLGSAVAGAIGYDDSLGSLYIGTTTTHNFLIKTDNTLRVTVSSAGVVTISNLAGTGSRAVLADASGNLSAPVSDISVKQNIEPLKYGLETILQLNAVQFEFIESYKNYGEGLQIGTIAQEVEQIIPEAVFTTPSTGLKGINYDQLNGIYIKAIQDLNNIIDVLLKRIEALENK